MTHATCLWLNRLSILLAYFSFWFVAPEFIGEARLRAWQLHAKKVIGAMIASWSTFVMGVALSMNLSTAIASAKAHHGFWRVLTSPNQITPPQRTIMIVLMVVGLALLIWGHRLVTVLANESKWRSISFAFGAILFTVSCGLQVAATIEKS
jgi:hypothetical protein